MFTATVNELHNVTRLNVKYDGIIYNQSKVLVGQENTL